MLITEEQRLQLHNNHISVIPENCILYNKSNIKQKDLDGYLKENFPNVRRTTNIDECDTIITRSTYELYNTKNVLKVTFLDTNDSFIFYNSYYLNTKNIHESSDLENLKNFRPDVYNLIIKELMTNRWCYLSNFFESNSYKMDTIIDYTPIIEKDYFNTKILNPFKVTKAISKWKYSTREKVDDDLFNNIMELINGDLKTGLRVAKNMDLSDYLLEMLYEFFIQDKRNIGKLIKQYHPEFYSRKSAYADYERFIYSIQDFIEQGYNIDKEKLFNLLILKNGQ